MCYNTIAMRVSIRHTSLRRGFARTMSGISQRSPAALTAFGETIENDPVRSTPTPSTYASFFTGKPHVVGLGHAFLFRNYRASLGKWQTADPLGYPDGWNQLAYCGNLVQQCIDVYSGEAAIIGSFYDALKHYAYGNGVPAIIFQSVMLQVLSTVGYVDNVLKGLATR